MALVEPNKNASGGFSVRYSTNPRCLYGAKTLVSFPCPICKRAINARLETWDSVALAPVTEVQFTLRSENRRRTLPIDVIEGEDGVLWLRPKGYGDLPSKYGQGLPIGVGLDPLNNKLEVYLYTDINKEDPKTVSMEGAREDARK